MNRIALFLPNWIGDVVMATPAVQAIRDAFPTADLIAVCKPYVADVLGGNPWFSEVVLADKRGPSSHRLFAVAAKLREKQVDAAVLFPNSFRSALMAWLAGCRTIVGFVRYCRGLLLTNRLFAKSDSHGRFVPSPAIDDYNRLARELGTANPGFEMRLFTEEKDESSADAVWEKFGLANYAQVVVLNPGAAFGAAKHWSIDSFSRLARMLTQRTGCGVLVLCGPTEREMARQIADGSRSPHAYSLHDEQLSLGLTKACVRRSDLLITTDSGPRHFAAAFGRPVVTLFGPTHIAWTETYYPEAIHLQKKVPCGPCQKRVCPLDHRCMRELTPSEVYRAAERLLARFPLVDGRETQRAA
ncbi:MAG TPA: lipopolysaccharide heptosyltransferase II [Gemmata sp.]|jgi:heptosyltransferase-2|nr:lipopolysaccharide heptosyltransferase II [Gemmata sp.]